MGFNLNSCRVCLEQEGIKNIFEEQDNILLSKKIVYCASVQISQDDLLSKMICDQCLFYLDIAYAFRVECESSDKRMRQLLKGQLRSTVIHSGNNKSKSAIENHFKNMSFEQTYIVESKESNLILPKVHTELVQPNCICNKNSVAIEIGYLKQKTETYSSFEKLKLKVNSKDKVGRHIAKKISGKLPQRLCQNVCNDRLTVSEDISKNKILLNDAYLNRNDNTLEFEEVLESSIPVVVSEETVVTENNFSFGIDITCKEQNEKHKTSKQQYAVISSDSKNKLKNKKFKVSSKLKMTLRKGNRKVNVFKDVKDIRVKQKGREKGISATNEKAKKEFKCDICNKLFLFRSHLKRHMNKHTGAKSYNCEFCEQKFVNKYNLNVHMSKHTGDFPLKCEICGKGLPNPSLLKRHMVTHTGEQRFQCRYCSVKFRQSSSLRSHEKMHLNRPSYHCDICFKVFSYNNSLSAHRKLHFGAQRFSCDICLSTFSRKSSLIRHMGEHTKSKKIQCKFCNLSFHSKSSYSSHLKIHCKYKCEICGQGFRYKSNFTEHVKNH